MPKRLRRCKMAPPLLLAISMLACGGGSAGGGSGGNGTLPTVTISSSGCNNLGTNSSGSTSFQIIATGVATGNVAENLVGGGIASPGGSGTQSCQGWKGTFSQNSIVLNGCSRQPTDSASTQWSLQYNFASFGSTTSTLQMQVDHASTTDATASAAITCQ